ncbi:hypothetical protein LTR49_027279 [Elasticomyces elasticus]|nr:hypothetical protein LTR49_027279 [Elasticomyces elasticus]
MPPPPPGNPNSDPTNALLPIILKSFDRLVPLTRDAIAKDRVNVFDQHRVNSFLASRPYQKPLFNQLLKSTYKHYQRVWKQILFFVYRLAYLRQSPNSAVG